MSDAALSALFGSARIQSISTGSTTQNTQQPQLLENVSIGGLIKGFVVNRDRENNPILRTPQGDVLVKSDVFLKTGSEVVIRVEPSRARIISVNGESIQNIQQRQEREAVGNNQDRVLQSSMLAPKPEKPIAEAITSKAQFLAETKLMREMIQLDAILLKPSASSSNPVMQQTMASILKLPPNALHLLEKGAPLQFRVVGSELHIKLPPIPTTPTAQAPATQPTTQAGTSQTAPLPTTTTAATNATNTPSTQPVQALYQLYTKLVKPQSIAAPTATPAIPTPIPAASTTLIAPTPVSSSIAATNTATTPNSPIAAMEQQMAQAANSSTLTPTTATPTATTPAAPTPTNAATPAPLGATALNAATPPATNTSPTLATMAATTSPSVNPTTHPTTVPAAAPTFTPAASGTTTVPSSATAVTPPPGTITARVIGVEPTGETILRTPIGTVKLFTGSPPPLHSVLQLQLVVAPQTNYNTQLPPPSPVSPAMVTFASLAHDWSALDEAYQLIQRADPNIMREFTSRIPNTKSALVNSVLFFISALGTSSVRQWLGARTSELLDEKSPALMSRLMSDFSGIRAVLRDQPDQPWQMLPFPILHEKELNQGRLFIRKDDSGKTGEESGGTRFIVELSMSELGEIQLDGLVQKREARTQFDLVLRSEQPLPERMQNDIQQLFTTAAEATGYQGALRFQPEPARFVLPLAEANRPSNPDTGSIIA